MSAGMTLTGDRRLARKWDAMPRRVMSSRSSRIVLNAGCGPVARAAAARVAAKTRDTDILAKNIVVRHAKARISMKRVAVVGARNKVFFVRRTTKGKWRGVSKKKVSQRTAAGDEVRRVNPGKYAHLVEFGTGPKRPKKKRSMKMPIGFSMKAGPTKPQPFLRPAFDEAGGRGLEGMSRALEKAITDAMRG